MSIAPRNQAEQDRLEKGAKSFFRSRAWAVEDLTRGHGHFLAKTQRITLFVSCHDSEGRKFFPSHATLDALAKKGYGIKSTRYIPTAFIFAAHLPDVVPDIAAAQGIYLFTTEELSQVTDLERFQTELPPDEGLTERQKGILREELSLCLSIVERFREAGDRSAAIAWARGAAESAGRYTKAYEVWLGLLLNAGDDVAAVSLCEKILGKYPESLFFLTKMQMLSTKLKIEHEGEDWAARIALVKRREASLAAIPVTLETILQRQVTAISPRAEAASVPAVRPPSRGLRGLVQRIFAGSS